MLGGCGSDSGGAARDDAFWTGYARIVAVEDARGGRPPDELVAIARGGGEPLLRSWAVRGLGRLADPSVAPGVEPFLADPEPLVRVEAAHALAALRPPGEVRVPSLLRAGAEDPSELPGVRAAFAFALVRSARGPLELAAADTVLTGLTEAPPVRDGRPEEEAVRVVLARAWDLRARKGPEGWSDEVAGRGVRFLAAAIADGTSVADVRARRLVISALVARDALTPDLLDAALDDADPGVRRRAVAALGPEVPGGTEERLLALLDDPDATVRYAALGRYAGWLRPERGCGPVLAALQDPDPHVALAALDLLAEPCPARAAQRAALLEAADTGDGGRDRADGLRRAHALAALASVAPDEAAGRLEDAAEDPSPFVRAWVARGAARGADEGLLRGLAADPDPNVRTAALRGLGMVNGHGADSVYRAQLGSDDAQLVLTAVRQLEDTPDPVPAAEALANALRRFTAGRKETTRDVRMALLDALEGLGRLDAADLRPLVEDYDPVVAERAAVLLETLTGETVEARPRPLPPLAPPSAAELEELSRTTVILEMARGGEIAVRPLPGEAATNAARFTRFAREGWFDGLTFHRVVPNFIIQGGSPGANEYAGADRYTRDEVGRASHRAGTVGLSTRGRDTGDGQIFVNTVDNPRLDFAYTVFGEVVRGLDVARDVLEGDVIRRGRVEVAGR